MDGSDIIYSFRLKLERIGKAGISLVALRLLIATLGGLLQAIHRIDKVKIKKKIFQDSDKIQTIEKRRFH